MSCTCSALKGLDTDKDLLLSKLNDLIDSHHEDIMAAMKAVETISADLSGAERTVGNARGLMQRGGDMLQEGPNKVALLKRKAERLITVGDILGSISHMREAHTAMEGC